MGAETAEASIRTLGMRHHNNVDFMFSLGY